MARGRGTPSLLSRRSYKALGWTGAYTRRLGLDREANKALLVRHLDEASPIGATFADLHEVLSALSHDQVRALLLGQRADGRIDLRGSKRGARWRVIETPKTTP